MSTLSAFQLSTGSNPQDEDSPLVQPEGTRDKVAFGVFAVVTLVVVTALVASLTALYLFVL